jgi:glycosyltransferase involved in cell wall biosynthesis
LFVGRHAHVKGVDVLVDAVLRLRQGGAPTFSLDLVGDGELTLDLSRRIADAGFAGDVRFLGRLSDDDLARAFASCDCVVIPSRSESIPLALSEALQNRRPVIVTDVGDMGDLARRHGLGEVVPPGDAVALAAALRRFMIAPWQLDEGRVGRLLEELTFESAAPELLRRLEGMVATA